MDPDLLLLGLELDHLIVTDLLLAGRTDEVGPYLERVGFEARYDRWRSVAVTSPRGGRLP